MLAKRSLLIYIISVLGTVPALGVQVVNPIAAQLPLVARVGKHYQWGFMNSTFLSDENISYTCSTPDWLSFDPASLTFTGTPSISEVGSNPLTVVAQDSTSSARSAFTIPVSSDPPPVLSNAVDSQFKQARPSLASVFLLSPGSAIQADNPTLRVPERWSFSIGFDWGTFKSPSSDLYYDALMADGSPLPSWMKFNRSSITLNGYSPNTTDLIKYNMALHASDLEGYTVQALPFDLVVASHELSMPAVSLPTMNITAATYFNTTLSSPADFSGALVDGNPLLPSDIASLSIDTSQFAQWLHFDGINKVLSGSPPDDMQPSQPSLLPVTIVTNFNQSVGTKLSFAIVPSFFSAPDLPSFVAGKDGNVDFNLVQYYSNHTEDQSQSDVSLDAAFDPVELAQSLHFDPTTGHLAGNVPAKSASDLSHITATFTAYSHVTHSTSHSTLRIITSSSALGKSFGKSGKHLSAAARARLVLGLGVTFAVVGSLAVFAMLLAAFRRYARLDDTALGNKECRSVWSDSEKKWYGLDSDGSSSSSSSEELRGYGWSEKVPGLDRRPADIENPPNPLVIVPDTSQSKYGSLGHGFQRVFDRSPKIVADTSSGGVMKKGVFLEKIKRTVSGTSRKVSDGARSIGERFGVSRTRHRPFIGRPVMAAPVGILTLNNVEPAPSVPSISVSDAFEDDMNAIASFADSPSSSTDDRSIPRRRADFAPPCPPPAIYINKPYPNVLEPVGHARRLSVESIDSYADEAVVQTASRAMSVRSGISTGSVMDSPTAEAARPRLVPFTSASRVPIPQVPSLPPFEKGSGNRTSGNGRVPSQSAKFCKMREGEAEEQATLGRLSTGIHYVRPLGDDLHQVATVSTSAMFYSNPSSPSMTTAARSSFSSLESSHLGYGSGGARGAEVKRILTRVGETFRFHLSASVSPERKLEARLVSGLFLPPFVNFSAKGKGAGVDFYGIATSRDVGVLNIGVYCENDDECFARATLEVVERVGEFGSDGLLHTVL